jgi:hypothetical protein
MKQIRGSSWRPSSWQVAARQPSPETGSPQERTSDDTQVAAQAVAAKSKCQRQVEPIQDALHQLDGRLDVGLNNASYSERLGDVSVAYNQIDVETLEPGCLNVAVNYEKAFNRYVKAGNRWDSCIESYSCDEPDVQGLWAQASNEIEKADSRLGNVETLNNTLNPALPSVRGR